MPNKKRSQNPDQQPLFHILDDGSIVYSISDSIRQSNDSQSNNDEISSNNKQNLDFNKNNNLLKSNIIDLNSNCIENPKLQNVLNRSQDAEETKKLVIPIKFEDIVKLIGKNMARMAELIVPVTEFEEKIIQVVSDIDLSGYLLFLYGTSGVGKSTFISSLEFRKHIPIQKIESIDARKLIIDDNESIAKLTKLFKRIDSISNNFFMENKDNDTNKLCIVIDYLESLDDEDGNQVKGFFRDLNGLLRQYPIIIIWPVTEKNDLQTMQGFAKSFSSTMFHRTIPFIDFTGPLIQEYPNIAKRTIQIFNNGKTCYDFQLNDNDFEDLKNKYENKPKEKHLIRDYLNDVISIWERKTDYLSKIVRSVPRPTEVWFIFCYPEAENTVAQFAKQSYDFIDEMWNAEFKALYTYISGHTQRRADWSSDRLNLALNGILTTKIMYLPTNALVGCIAAYSKEAGLNISKEEFINDYKVPESWISKQHAKDRLAVTPLYFQLSGRSMTVGKRKSGPVKQALKTATEPFDKFNDNVYKKVISDQRFNKALYYALDEIFIQDQSNLELSCEKIHPFLPTIRPDILINVHNNKYICLEFCYTNDNTPGNMADYVLRKLNTYMKQLWMELGLPPL
jgi:hypothetical protein